MSHQQEVQECLLRINRLAKFAGPQQESAQIAEKIAQHIAEIHNATRLEQLEGSSDTLEFAAKTDQITLLESKFRSAQLSSRQLRRSAWFEQRQKYAKPVVAKPKETALFDDQKQPQPSQMEDLDPSIGVSEQVSANLRRIHQLAQAEVLRSELNIEELQSSSKALVDVQNQYSGVDMLLNGSRRLVKLLDQADTRDRRQMQMALSFLGAVLIWIIYRRVLKLPIKLLLWSVARLLCIAKLFVPKSGAAPPLPPSLDDDASLVASLESTLESTLDSITSTVSEIVEEITPSHVDL